MVSERVISVRGYEKKEKLRSEGTHQVPEKWTEAKGKYNSRVKIRRGDNCLLQFHASCNSVRYSHFVLQ